MNLRRVSERRAWAPGALAAVSAGAWRRPIPVLPNGPGRIRGRGTGVNPEPGRPRIRGRTERTQLGLGSLEKGEFRGVGGGRSARGHSPRHADSRTVSSDLPESRLAKPALDLAEGVFPLIPG